jgi:hypothetical protein
VTLLEQLLACALDGFATISAPRPPQWRSGTKGVPDPNAELADPDALRPRICTRPPADVAAPDARADLESQNQSATG